MVQTRSRATSPGHQESRDVSSNPHHDRQSGPIMQPSSVQHVQSMATTMAELTRQNQELTREINLRMQQYEGHTEGQSQSQEVEGMRNPKPSQETPLPEGCHNWKGKWTR